MIKFKDLTVNSNFTFTCSVDKYLKQESKMSVFSKKYWLEKGFTEDEAEIEIAKRRPSNILYWTNKGFTEEEAKIKVQEHQQKAGRKRKELSKEEQRKLSPRCIEFYLNKGLSKEEAQEELSKFQKHFSKEICIEKHGYDKGIQIWKERQEKWQETLNSKPKDEIETINKKKNRWQYLSAAEAARLKTQVSQAVRDTVSQRSIEDKRKVGKNISDGKVKFGYAIPRENLEDFENYKRMVWNETKKHNLNLLENYNLRGRTRYHLDHQYSIWQGFLDGVSPEIVGHFCNLKMIDYKENLSKHTKCTLSLEELKKLIKDFDAKI